MRHAPREHMRAVQAFMVWQLDSHGSSLRCETGTPGAWQATRATVEAQAWGPPSLEVCAPVGAWGVSPSAHGWLCLRWTIPARTRSPGPLAPLPAPQQAPVRRRQTRGPLPPAGRQPGRAVGGDGARLGRAARHGPVECGQ